MFRADFEWVRDRIKQSACNKKCRGKYPLQFSVYGFQCSVINFGGNWAMIYTAMSRPIFSQVRDGIRSCARKKTVEECWGHNFSFDRFQCLLFNFGDNWSAMLGFRKVQTVAEVHSEVQSKPRVI